GVGGGRGVVVVAGATPPRDHPPAPTRSQEGAPLKAAPRLEAPEVLHDFAAIEEMTIVEQITVEPGPVRHLPRVGDLAFHVDEVDGAVTVHRREERVARLGPPWIVCDEPRPGAPYLLLIHGGQCHLLPRRHEILITDSDFGIDGLLITIRDLN